MRNTYIDHIIDSLDNKHPLRCCKSKEYVDAFKDRILDLECLEDSKLKTLLCVDLEFNEDRYNQGISELMIYFLLSRASVSFAIEKKLNASNRKNVDVSVEYREITYNMEIKSPEYSENGGMNLIGRLANRFGDKNENENVMKEIADKLRGVAMKDGRDVSIEKMTDNKVKDCLLSCQEKFSDPTETICNILVIMTTTSEMVHYLNYLANDDSGFFNPLANVNRFRVNKKSLNRDMYDKVTAVILSNSITLNERYDATSWDISNAINIVLYNPSCKCLSRRGLQNLSEFFPHKSREYAIGHFDFLRTHTDFPEECFISEFMAEYGFRMNLDMDDVGKVTATAIKRDGEKILYVFDGTLGDSTMYDMDSFLEGLRKKFPKDMQDRIVNIRLLDKSELDYVKGKEVPLYRLNDCSAYWWLCSEANSLIGGCWYMYVGICGILGMLPGSVSLGVRPAFEILQEV